MAISWRKKEKHVEPYSKLALIYDEVMSHVDYETWANYISKIIEKWNSSATSLIDIACGTGNILLKLLSSNFKLLGFDYSFNMIKQAKQKITSKGCSIPLWLGTIKHFALNYSIDVIICLYDSFNYMIDLEECDEVFKYVYDGLQKNGLFIFDICTEKNSIKFFDNLYERNRGKNYSYTRISKYDRITRIHSNIFKINFKQSNDIFVEIHEQKIYYIDELIQAINRTNFKIIDVLDGFSFKRASENSTRAHFVLKKVIK